MIECKICGKNFKVIAPTHCKKHGISMSEYTLKYGETHSQETRLLMSKAAVVNNQPRRGIPREKSVKEKIRVSVLHNYEQHPEIIEVFRKKQLKYFETHDGVFKGKKFSDSHRKNLSDSKKANITEEFREGARVRALAWCMTMKGRVTNTKQEVLFEKWINERGYRIDIDYKHPQGLYNVLVDFYFFKLKLVVELDGCYWHYCPEHKRNSPHSERPDKDAENTRKLENAGCKVVRIWEHDALKSKFDVVEKLLPIKEVSECRSVPIMMDSMTGSKVETEK